MSGSPETVQRMPAAFFGHGNPMLALDYDNPYTRGWRAYGESIPRPRAILAISAHWYINGTAVTATAAPVTIHDFYGFPDELFAVEYPAPGDPDLAGEIAELAKPVWVGQDTESWGLDHGTWSVLRHMFPAADIPVVQLSLDATKSFEYHVDLGARLAPLRDKGVLIVCSGNIVHNLRMVRWNQPGAAFDWAVEFDEAATELMSNDPGAVASLADHHHFNLAAPTPDHLIPLLYLGGLAAAGGATATPHLVGYDMGSLSMTAHLLAA